MTYQFQATVGPLAPGVGDVDLPFTLEEGSVIDGLITIDPSLGEPPRGGNSRSIQPFDIELMVAGFTFGAETYNTIVINNTVIADGSHSGPVDFVGMTCSSSISDIPCNSRPLQYPGFDPLTLGIIIDFLGESFLLTDHALPENVDTWNGFQFERSMVIGFITKDGRGDTYGTHLSSFTLVPEPSALVLLICACLLIISSQTKKRRATLIAITK